MRRKQTERRRKIDEIEAIQKVLDADIARAHKMIDDGNAGDAKILSRSIDERCEMVAVLISEVEVMP